MRIKCRYRHEPFLCQAKAESSSEESSSEESSEEEKPKGKAAAPPATSSDSESESSEEEEEKPETPKTVGGACACRCGRSGATRSCVLVA